MFNIRNVLYIFFLAYLFTSGNPEKKDFVIWAKGRIDTHLSHQSTIGGLISFTTTPAIISEKVTRKNYYLFSIFILNDEKLNKLIASADDAKSNNVYIGGGIIISSYIILDQSMSKKIFGINSSKTKDEQVINTPQSIDKYPIPKINTGTPYSKVRDILMKNNWKPVTQNEECSPNCQRYRVSGWIEANECAGTGEAPCIFTFKNKEGRVLEIITIGEEPEYSGYR